MISTRITFPGASKKEFEKVDQPKARTEFFPLTSFGNGSWYRSNGNKLFGKNSCSSQEAILRMSAKCQQRPEANPRW